MKAFKLVLLGIALFFASTVHAQVSVNISLGSPPAWGPVGYSGVRYYYLPDVEAYYDVQTSMFIYIGRGTWIHRTYLPACYSGYDLYGGYKVVMPDYHGDRPYIYFKEHKIKYAKGYHGPSQKTIGYKPGNRNNNSKSNYNAKAGQNNQYSGGNNNTKATGKGKSNNKVSQDNNKNSGHGSGKKK